MGRTVTEVPRKVVRITGERNGMIAFDYGLDDLDYALELLLPPDAFEAFCRANAVVLLEGERLEDLDPAARGMALRPSDVGPRI